MSEKKNEAKKATESKPESKGGFVAPEGYRDYGARGIDGFFDFVAGLTVEGVLLLRGEQRSKFSKDDQGFYQVALTAPCKAVNGDEDKLDLIPGQVVQVNEKYRLTRLAKWFDDEDKPLAHVIIHVDGKSTLQDGRTMWDVQVFAREATRAELATAGV